MRFHYANGNGLDEVQTVEALVLGWRVQKWKYFAHAPSPGFLIVAGAFVANERKIVPQFPSLSDKSISQSDSVVDTRLRILTFRSADIEPDLLR